MYSSVFLVTILLLTFENSVLGATTKVKTVVNESMVFLSQIEGKLRSKCFTEEPDYELTINEWGYDDEQMRIEVERVVNEDLKTCKKLDLCPELLDWMKKKSKTTSSGPSKKKSYDAILAESFKKIPHTDGNPFLVSLAVFIESISAVSEVDQSFDVGFFVGKKWKMPLSNCSKYMRGMAHKGIPGLSIDMFEEKGKVFGDEEVFKNLPNSIFTKIGPEHYDIFWLPDIFLENSKSVSRQIDTFVTSYMDISIKMKLDTIECNFFLLDRFTATIPCDMNFNYYPIDFQMCEIRFRSFESNSLELKIDLEYAALQDDIIQNGLGDQYVNLTAETVVVPRFGQLRVIAILSLRFQRTLVPVMVADIVPSILIVTISFSSLWLGIDYLGDRINIGMICLLAVLAQFSQTRLRLPPTSNITFMDYWMILCIFSVICQLLQVTLVYFLFNYEKSRIAREKEEKKKKAEKQTIILEKSFQEGAKRENANSALFVGEQLRRRRMSQGIQDDIRIWEEDKLVEERFVEEETSERNSFVDMVMKVESMLLEPPVKKTSARYLPMKADSITRILFPTSFIGCVIAYWHILLSTMDSKYSVI